MTLPTTQKIRDVSDIVTKGTTPTTVGRNYTSSGINFLKVETFTSDGIFIPGKQGHIDESTHQLLKRSQLAEGDILFSIAGALGRSTIVDKSWLPANTNQAFAIIRPSSRNQAINPRYLLWQLRSPAIAKRIAEINVQAAQANLSLEQVREFDLLSLPRAEQNVIAAALDDVDQLVAALKRLVSKKQAIKQGMMQELLTGRTRLPGFYAKWPTEKIGSVLRVRHGRSQSGIEKSNGRYPILATGGEIGRTDTPIYSRPSVLIGRKGTIDRPQYRDEPFWTVDTLFYTEILPQAVPLYIFYLFQTIDWKSMNEASGVPSLSSSRIESIEITLPPVEEQKAIAQVLHDADDEIAALERRLETARNIKQGMMQELLSGRTRLPIEEVSS